MAVAACAPVWTIALRSASSRSSRAASRRDIVRDRRRELLDHADRPVEHGVQVAERRLLLCRRPSGPAPRRPCQATEIEAPACRCAVGCRTCARRRPIAASAVRNRRGQSCIGRRHRVGDEQRVLLGTLPRAPQFETRRPRARAPSPPPPMPKSRVVDSCRAPCCSRS